MSIEEKQLELINEFSYFENWDDKYQYIIDLGKNLAPMPEKEKTDDRLINGCQSKVWIDVKLERNLLVFYADSDGILPKGIVALLVYVYNGHSTQEIIDSTHDFIEKIGLQEFLSPSRANGLMAMIKQIKFYALAYQIKK